ncbi:hypothetical protein CHS0354_027317 [Potamilus streckersoni]|uniref:EF-hand domain-containing protein n=1 Tax=Potamilus streckersoni TaxID=2493646 RepID=A0AAE0VRH1_9BIVA|nr:hypothetical protein CHS0354_027317 [Potamilus streckersoni]
MATSMFQRISLLHRKSVSNIRNFHSIRVKGHASIKGILIGVPCACAFIWHSWQIFKKKRELIPMIHAAQVSGEERQNEDRKLTYREQRFQQFASVEYQGIIYMTPQDFLESVTEETPRLWSKRTQLTAREVEIMLRNTPSKQKRIPNLFHLMHNKGLISYTEYLFLLCVVTKPHSGFRIAFNMFDTDGNQIVDKKEFLVLESVFSKQHVEAEPEQQKKTQSVEPVQDTTLLIHFFGPKGQDVLKYEDFHRFMENLQSEVLELEFTEFSKGLRTISEEDFARILLRYTLLDKSEIEACIDRVHKRIPQAKGITFTEFKKFCQFLNSLDDFTIAMKMYTFAEHPVSQEDFQRAVMVCTGFTLGSHVVDTVFQIFDEDGDGHLSHKEFISIMKDRMHRGFKSHASHTQAGWDSFKSCVKNEMKSY